MEVMGVKFNLLKIRSENTGVPWGEKRLGGKRDHKNRFRNKREKKSSETRTAFPTLEQGKLKPGQEHQNQS